MCLFRALWRDFLFMKMSKELLLIPMWMLSACGKGPSTIFPVDAPTETRLPATASPTPPITPAPSSTPKPENVSSPAHPGRCPNLGQRADDFLVIGYLPDYRPLEPSWGSCLTDLIYFSAEPLADGTLDTHRLSPETLRIMREVKARYGTRIHISIGGYDRSDHFAEMVANQQARMEFINHVVRFCQQYDLDGVDFDWEFPQGSSETRAYASLMSEIRGRGLIVSVALSPRDELAFKYYAVADRIHVMSYDRGAQHATFEQAVLDLALFEDGGIPKEKLILGIPFYGRRTTYPTTSFAYAEIVEQHDPLPGVDEIEGVFFNGMVTVKHKTCHAHAGGYGGVMIWELGQDSMDETSLLRAIHEAANLGCGP